jgi:hypothetical protein
MPRQRPLVFPEIAVTVDMAESRARPATWRLETIAEADAPVIRIERRA